MTEHNPFEAKKQGETTFSRNSEIETIDDGDYEGKLLDLTMDTSKKGDPMWVWEFVGTEGALNGKQFKMWTVDTPQAEWKLNQTCQALGLGEEVVENGKRKFKAEFTLADARGRRCILTIKNEEYQGRTSPKVAGIKRHPKGPVASNLP